MFAYAYISRLHEFNTHLLSTLLGRGTIMVKKKAPQKEIVDLVRYLADDPFLVQELIDAGKAGRSSRLRRFRSVSADRSEIRQVVHSLMIDKHPPRPSAERPVEWVAAVATLVAGALAA